MKNFKPTSICSVKKLLFYLVFFTILSLFSFSKTSAELIKTSFTGPANNTITTSNSTGAHFTFTFKVPTGHPNVIDAIYFQPSIDGVAVNDSPLGARYIFNGKEADYAGETKTVEFDLFDLGPFDAKKLSWKLTDFYTGPGIVQGCYNGYVEIFPMTVCPR